MTRFEPPVDGLRPEPPVLADLLARNFPFLRQLVQSGLRDLEVNRKLGDGHHVGL